MTTHRRETLAKTEPAKHVLLTLAGNCWRESDEQAGPALASTTIELPGGVRIRVEVPMDPKPGWPLEDQA